MLKFLTFAFCGMAAICGCEEMGGLLWNYLNLRLMEETEKGICLGALKKFIRKLERPIKVEILPCGLERLHLDNFGQYAKQYYNAAITFRRLMYTLIYYHAQSNPTSKDRNAYELALCKMGGDMGTVQRKE